MKKLLILAALMLPTQVQAEPLAYPGAAWANVTGPHVGGEEEGNWIFSGKVEQGIDWAEVDGWRLKSFTSIFVSKDIKGYEWNNKVTPAIGASLHRDTQIGTVEVGVQYVSETHYGDKYVTAKRSAQGVQMFANYWVGWGR